MNYRDVYFSRINHLGETTAEVIRNSGIRSFERWMAQSPFTIKDLSVERGFYFSGIIEEKKDEKQLKTLYLHVANDIPIKVGDIMNWRADDGSIEKWILLQEERKVNGTYRTFWIIRCNYLVKWIDNTGRLKKSWAYVVSSQDDKIKGNFRTWHNLITPQPNKYAEIVMPKVEIDRGTNFIIEDEGWKLVELDWTSVPGIIYLSLTESKINYQYDDIDVDIADTDKLQFPALAPVYSVGDVLDPDFGEFTFNEWEVELIPQEGAEYLELRDDKWVAIAPGNVTIIMQLRNRKAVQKRFELAIKELDSDFMAYISGADTIRLDRESAYELVSEGNVYNAEYSLTEESQQLAILKKLPEEQGQSTTSKIIVRANDKNKLGDIVLIARYGNKEYRKTIKIVPLW